jgi:hypothetical protein
LPGKKHTDEMIGDAMREAGMLLWVFTPLYEIFEPKPHSWIMLLALLGVGTALLVVGIQVERRRDD